MGAAQAVDANWSTVVLTASTPSVRTYFPDSEAVSLRSRSGLTMTEQIGELEVLLESHDVVVVTDRLRWNTYVDPEIRAFLLEHMHERDLAPDNTMLVLVR